MRYPNIAAKMGERGPAAGTVLVRTDIRAGKELSLGDFRAQFQEQFGRCQPAHLQAVLNQVLAEQRLVNQIIVREIPGVWMFFVLVADAGQETPTLDGEAVTQLQALEPRFLDLRFLVDEGQIQITPKVGVDIGTHDQLGVVQGETALGMRVFACQQEARNRPLAAGAIDIGALQDQRDIGVEGACWRRR